MQASFQIIQVPKPCSWTEKYSKKKDGNRSSSQNSFATTYSNVFATNNVEIYDLKASTPLNALIFLMLSSCHSHAICMRSYSIYMYLYAMRMWVVCTRISSVCHSYVLVCNGMSLTFILMSSVYDSYVLVCHPYVTRMYSYIIRMSLVCHPYVTRMSSVRHSCILVCIYMSSLSHLRVLICHPYVTRMRFYHEPFKKVKEKLNSKRSLEWTPFRYKFFYYLPSWDRANNRIVCSIFSRKELVSVCLNLTQD